MAIFNYTRNEQMEFAKNENVLERISFSACPVLPEVADFMIENETHSGALSVLCENLFHRPDSEIWTSTLAKAAKRKVEEVGVDYNEEHYAELGLTAIALHLNTDVATLRFLFTLNHEHINWGLANNPNTPQDILDELADNPSSEVHGAVYNNPNASNDTIKKIKDKYHFNHKPNVNALWYAFYKIKIKASGN